MLFRCHPPSGTNQYDGRQPRRGVRWMRLATSDGVNAVSLVRHISFACSPKSSRMCRLSAVLTIVVVAVLLFSSSVESVGRKKLLVLTHVASLYKHDMLPFLEQAVPELGRAGGFDVTSLEGYKEDADELDLSMDHSGVPRAVRRGVDVHNWGAAAQR